MTVYIYKLLTYHYFFFIKNQILAFHLSMFMLFKGLQFSIIIIKKISLTNFEMSLVCKYLYCVLRKRNSFHCLFVACLSTVSLTITSFVLVLFSYSSVSFTSAHFFVIVSLITLYLLFCSKIGKVFTFQPYSYLVCTQYCLLLCLRLFAQFFFFTPPFEKY